MSVKRRDIVTGGIVLTLLGGGYWFVSRDAISLTVVNASQSERTVTITLRSGGTVAFERSVTLEPGERTELDDVAPPDRYRVRIETDGTHLKQSVDKTFCRDPGIRVTLRDGGGIGLATGEC